jgi:Concanavalin A-like lectin/glucanases superfamily
VRSHRIDYRLLTTLAVLASLTLTLAAVGSGPAAGVHRAHVAPGTTVLLTFDHRESLKRGTVVRDQSGHRHGGTVLTRNGGALRRVDGLSHRGIGFPVRCCGRAIVQVHDGAGLDPRHRPFVFGAAVRLGRVRARSASNVVQKGYFNQAGGQYKLQLLAGGVPSCVLYGGKGRITVKGSGSIADGAWHRIACLRAPKRVQLRVDGRAVAGARGVVGFIGNAAPMRIGGKKVTVRNKQYRGSLDNVFLRLL